jgi:AcrR family transcriptional regulator
LGPKERRVREREEIRSRILDAARELFLTEGYEAVTMRKVADRIEYSPTAIYFHFRDKETLIRELCDADFRTLAHQFTAIATIGDPVERLRSTGLAYFDFATNYPNHYRLMFMTPHPPMDPEATNIAQGDPQEDAYAFLKHVVNACIAAGRVREELADAELMSQTMWAGVHGVVSLQIAKSNDPWVDWRPLRARVEAMIDVLVRGMLLEDRRPRLSTSEGQAKAPVLHESKE